MSMVKLSTISILTGVLLTHAANAQTASCKALVEESVKEHLGVEDAKMSSTLTELGADSLDSVELVMHFEEKLGIDISDQDACTFTEKKVSDIVKYLAASRKCR
jgi:acyl carrier protein